MKNIQRETQDLQAEKEEMQKELAVLKEDVYKTKSAVSYLQCCAIFGNIKKKIAVQYSRNGTKNLHQQRGEREKQAGTPSKVA